MTWMFNAASNQWEKQLSPYRMITRYHVQHNRWMALVLAPGDKTHFSIFCDLPTAQRWCEDCVREHSQHENARPPCAALIAA